MLVLLVACAEPTESSGGRASDTVDSGTPGDSVETATPPDSPADSPADSAETGDTGQASGPWTPPPWMPEADATTIPAERGRTWEEDPDFALTGFSVPMTFVGPDGRYGMLVSDMRGTDTFPSRYLLTSDDGLEWEESGALLRPEDWSYGCVDKLTHATVWRESEGVWTFLAEGGPEGDGYDLAPPRYGCAASTSDLASFTYDAAPTFTGAFDGDMISIPAALTSPEGDAILWYNGDLLSATSGGPGIRVARITAGERVVESIHADPVSDGWEDAYPVYVEGGHVRLYARYSSPDSEETGIALVELDDDLLPTGGPVQLLPASGTCSTWPWRGDCTGDPTLLHLPDDQLVLYYYKNTFADDGSFTTAIVRAFATD